MSELNQAYSLGLRSVGDDVTIWAKAQVIGAENISIGDSVIIDDFAFIMAAMHTTIGSFVHIAVGATIAGGGEFVMEDFSGLSGGVRVYTGNEDYQGNSLTNPAVPPPYRNPTRSFVHIGRHAIIGANSVVLPGVEVSEGAAVGALSLVNRSLEPWTVYLGSPARPIGDRPKDKILQLEAQLREALFDKGGHYIPASRRMAL
jgi:galactoside O-acetyltransferase